MSWTAIVPIKSPGDRKSRLAAQLSQADRVQLSDSMLWHVLGVLQQTPDIAEILVVSATRPAGWQGSWVQDAGRGLNTELQTAAGSLHRNVLVIHADLPALAVDDVAALIAAAEKGVAIAPDRHQSGTNALAVQDVTDFCFHFGAQSFALHREAAGARGTVVCRDGLALDIDLPEDLSIAIGVGALVGKLNAESERSVSGWSASRHCG